MKIRRRSLTCSSRVVLAIVVLACCLDVGRAQPAAAKPGPLNWTTQQDHQNMKDQLGITQLRPGRNGNPNATNNPANYDPAKASPFPDLPALLVTRDGRKAATPEL